MIEVLNFKNSILKPTMSKSFLADVSYLPNGDKKPLVIFAHGYRGFKDWGPWDLVAQAFAQAGCYFVKFNFSQNGTTLENPLEFDDLEAFGNNTYSQEQFDLNFVIDYFKDSEEVDNTRVFLIGHSRGGGSVMLQAYHNPVVTGIITWAGVSDFKKRFPHGARFDAWKERGVYYSLNGRTKQEMPHYFTFYEDYAAHERELNVQYAAQHLKKPTLIIHGSEDESVSINEAHLLHQWISGSELIEIPNAKHTFGGKHPWDDKILPHELDQVVKHTVKFIFKR